VYDRSERPRRLRDVAWHWLVAVEIQKSWELEPLRATSNLHFISFLQSNDDGTLLRVRTTGDDQRPRHFALDDYRWVVPALPRSAGLFRRRVQSGAAGTSREVWTLVPLTDTDVEPPLELASFELSCVADTLYCGMYSMFFSKHLGLS
jgi:hypothetical protein